METGISPRTGAVLSTFLASLMFGTSYVAVKLAVGQTNPLLLGAGVMAVGSLMLVPVMLQRGTLTWSLFRRWEFWVGSLANTWVVTTSYVGLTMTTASAAGLIIGTNVIFVALLSRLLFEERLGWKRGLGVLTAMLGLVTLTTRWDLTALESARMTGNLLLLLSAAGIGVTVVLSRVALRRLEPDQWSFGMHMLLPLTLLALTPLIPMEGGLEMSMLPAVLFIGAVCTTVPTVLWTGALRHISVVTSATVLMVESAFAVLLSWLLLGERLDALAGSGAALILVAILILARTD
jgi:drug/metabolite transporter (DMT)-like permease